MGEDFARQMKWLVDEVFPEVELMRVVLDNLNTHTPAVLYQTFLPEEARRLTRKLAFHCTLKHGSWLNMAEIEFSILAHQCLDRRLPDRESVHRQVDAWAKARSEVRATVQWRFTTANALLKFHRFYHISRPCGCAAQRRNEKKVVLGRAQPSQTLLGAGAWVRGPPARVR